MRDTSSQTLADMFKSGRQKRYSPGELVVQGEEPSGVYYIESGFVKVYSINDDGNKYLHVIYHQGEIFPLIWALRDIQRRVYYEALSDISTWELPKQKFLSYIHSDAKLANETITQLAEQFYVYADRLDNLQYKRASERVIYRLLFLASRFGEHVDSKIVIAAPITHELIAESVNLARETVSREIEILEERHLIDREGGHIVILDTEKLSKEFSEPITLNLWGLKTNI